MYIQASRTPNCRCQPESCRLAVEGVDKRCGYSWEDANGKCGRSCTDNLDQHGNSQCAYAGEKCYADLSPDVCIEAREALGKVAHNMKHMMKHNIASLFPPR